MAPKFWIANAAALCLLTGQAWCEPDGRDVRTLPVPTAPIYPGQTLDQSLLTTRQFQTSPRSRAGIATRADELLGRQARRRLAPGVPVPLSAVGVPLAVKRGAVATASYRDDGFSISASVIVLEDGSVGDVIHARATETGAVLDVQVLDGGELAVIAE